MFEDVFGAPFVPSKLIKIPFPFGHFWTVSVFEVCCPWLLPFMSLRAKEEDGDTWGWHRTAVSKWCCFSHSLQLILSSQIMCRNRATPWLPKGDTLIFMVNWKELRRDLLAVERFGMANWWWFVWVWEQKFQRRYKAEGKVYASISFKHGFFATGKILQTNKHRCKCFQPVLQSSLFHGHCHSHSTSAAVRVRFGRMMTLRMTWLARVSGFLV